MSSVALMQTSTLREAENAEQRACCKAEGSPSAYAGPEHRDKFGGTTAAVASTISSRWSAVPMAVQRKV